MATCTRAIVVLAICVAGCRGDHTEQAPAQTRHDAALQPPDIPIVASTVATTPLPDQLAGVIAIDGRGLITTAEVVHAWDGRMPAATTPLAEADLEKLWLGDQRAGAGTRLALEADELTPAKWRAAKQRRQAQASRIVLDSMSGGATSHMVRATVRQPTGADVPAILASPKAPARALAQVIILRGGTLIVQAGPTSRTLVELASYAGPSAPAQRPWLELQLDDRGVEIVLLPATRDQAGSDYATRLIAWHQLDRATLQAGLAMNAAAATDLDLVIGDGATVQQMIDVIALLETLGVRTFGIAERPAERRTQSLGREWIRRSIRQHLDEFTYCYEYNLSRKPALAGTVTTSFWISPDGHTEQIVASGVDPDVADCVALVLERVRFPAFDQPAGLHVNYPFAFRPAGP